MYIICKQYGTARACSARNFPTFLGRLWRSTKIYSIVSAKRNKTGRRKDQILRLSCQKYYAICSKTAGNYFSYQSCLF